MALLLIPVLKEIQMATPARASQIDRFQLRNKNQMISKSLKNCSLQKWFFLHKWMKKRKVQLTILTKYIITQYQMLGGIQSSINLIFIMNKMKTQINKEITLKRSLRTSPTANWWSLFGMMRFSLELTLRKRNGNMSMANSFLNWMMKRYKLSQAPSNL